MGPSALLEWRIVMAMKRALMFILAVACVAVASADNPQAVKKQLQANYNAISQAVKNNKVDKLGSMLTDDYTAVQKNGQSLTKQQVMTEFKGLASQLRNTKWVRTVKSVALSGNQAVAIVDGNFSGQITDPRDNKTHSLSQVATSKDTWIKKGGKYLLQKSEVQKNTMTMDGKAMTAGQ